MEGNGGTRDRKQMEKLIIFQLQVAYWIKKFLSHPSIHLTALFLRINKYIILLRDISVITIITTYPQCVCPNGGAEGKNTEQLSLAQRWACISRWGLPALRGGHRNKWLGSLLSQRDKANFLSNLRVSQEQISRTHYCPNSIQQNFYSSL